MMPKAISSLYSNLQAGEDFFKAMKLLSILFFLEYFTKVAYDLSLNKYVQHLLQKLRASCYEKWLLSYEAFNPNRKNKEKYPLGEVLSRLMSDTEAVMELVDSGSFTIFIDFVFIVSCLVSFVTLNTTSGIFLIASEIFFCIFLLYASRFMAKIYLDVRKSTGVMSKVLSDVTRGMRTTYFVKHNGFASKTSEASFDDFLKKQLKVNVWDASYYSVAESLFPILLALLIFIVPYSGFVEFTVIAVILDLIQRSIGPIKDIASKISSIQRARTAIMRIEEFECDLENEFKTQIKKYEEQSGFKNLSVLIDKFSYTQNAKDSFSLKNIKFTGLKGGLIGVVGFSGSGKSTLFKIISAEILGTGFHVELEKMDGSKLIFRGVEDEALSEYRSYVSLISQDSHLFSDSLEFNITLGQRTLEEFILFWNDIKKRIPYLENFKVHEILNPQKLSLGQKQLISTLRSGFLKKPIVLLDEISSALDPHLELALREAIMLLQQQALTIIIAHRIETIINASLILVMEDGQVVSSGTHNELLKDSPLYNRFIDELKV